MTVAPPKIAKTVWHVVPDEWRRRLRYTRTGRQFLRFVPVSAAALITGQVSLALLLIARVSPGVAGVAASMIAAAVSYVLSRWAWRRKGRPHVLKETVPFWCVSVGTWFVLGATSHFASIWAKSMGLHHWQYQAVVQAAYLCMNGVTFLTRFAIFHYVLFAERVPGSPSAAASVSGPDDPAPEALVALAPASRGPAGGDPARSAGR
jgi:putative flippase GtrA